MKKTGYLLFECLGDREKNILGTVIVGLLAKKYPARNIIVVSNTMEVWLHNPLIYRVFPHGGTPYFYEDYIEGKDTIVFRQDPFKTSDFIHQDTHILTLWAELCGVTYTNEKPELYFTQREKEIITKLTSRDKPVVIFNPYEVSLKDAFPRQWARNIPAQIAMQIANEIHAHGFHPIMPATPDTPNIPGIEKINLSGRLALALPITAAGIISSHSYLIHIGRMYSTPTAVVWGANTPKVYGYEHQTNFEPDVTNIDFCEPWCLSIPPQSLTPIPPQVYHKMDLHPFFEKINKKLK